MPALCTLLSPNTRFPLFPFSFEKCVIFYPKECVRDIVLVTYIEDEECVLTPVFILKSIVRQSIETKTI
jgi:hypothetical protein